MLQDLRYAFRMIRQYPWFSAAIIVTLALGIGANTTVFTLVNAVLFKPLDFPGGERLVMVPGTILTQARAQSGISYPDFRDYKLAAASMESMEAYSGMGANISEKGNPPERYRGARITGGLFDMLHIKPVLGRTFTTDDEKAGAERRMLISYGVWKDRYGRDPNVIGRSVRVNDNVVTITGVMPDGFKFPQNEDVWLNLVPDAEWEKRDNMALMLVAMLKPGKTVASAQAELDVVAQRLRREFPDSHKDRGVAVRTFHEVMNGGPIRLMFSLLMGSVGFVLLIACANVANMLLARALTRRREISIRVAMGASRGRILRQLLVESVVLSTIGGLIGLFIAKGAVRAFDLAVADVGKPYWITFEMNYVVLGFFAAVCILSGMLFGFVPALQATKIDLNSSLKEGVKSSGSRRTGYLSAGLVVLQFTLAVVLLSAAGLMIRSFLAAQDEFAFVSGDQVLHARVNLPDSRYPTPDSRRQFFEKLAPRLAGLPGAQSVAFVSNTPGSGSNSQRFEIAGQPIPEAERRPTLSSVVAGPGYFHLLGVNLVQGRDFDATDGLPGKESVIVSREFVNRFFPRQNPLGQKIRLFDREGKPKPWMTITGISPDLRYGDPGRGQDGPIVTLPHNFEAQGWMAVLIRTPGNGTALTPALRASIQELDGEMPLFDVRTLEESFQRGRWHLQVFGTLFMAFAGIAMGLAAVGIYAVIAHATAQRTREIGVRLALGADAGTIIRMVLGRGIWQVGLGMGIGLGAAYYLCQLMGSLLIKVSPSDPSTYVFVGLTLFVAGLAACLLPARRASRLDPLQALRHE